MAIIRKTNPKALDIKIDEFQLYLFDNIGYSDYESYHRAYMNPVDRDRGLIPEVFTTNGGYDEVFYNDGFNISSFFLANENRDISEDRVSEVDVALIVAADLVKLFPAITHRADEELNNDIHYLSMAYDGFEEWALTSIETGIDNVYREFDKDQIDFDNMSNQYVVRFNYKVKYIAECCTNC